MPGKRGDSGSAPKPKPKMRPPYPKAPPKPKPKPRPKPRPVTVGDQPSERPKSTVMGADRPMTRAERERVSRQIALDKARKNPPAKQGVDGAVSGWIGDRVSEAKDLGVGVVVESAKLAAALGTLVGPGSTADKKKALKEVGRQAAAFPQGIEAIVPNPKRLPYGDVSLVQWNDGIVPDFWVRGGENEDSKVASEMWRNQQLGSALIAAGVVAPVAAAGSVSRIAKTLMKNDPSLSKTAAFKLARKETRAPGTLAKQGIKGGIEPRVLRSTVGDKTREVTVPQSRSVLGRGVQEVADTVSRALPKGKPFSERQRANAAIRRAVDHAQKVEQARVSNLMRPVRDVGYSRLGKSSKPDQALMAYALQTPRGDGALAGPKAVRARLQQILDDGGYDQHGLSPDEQRFLRAQIDGLDEALKNPPDSETFTLAIDALEQVAAANENIGLYVALGRARGKPPEVAAAIREAFEARKNLVARDVGMEGQARGYFPHVRAEEQSVRNFLGATRRPAVGDTLGVPKPQGVNLHSNQLVLFRGGRLNVDPRVLLSTYYKRLKFLWAEEQRRDMFNEALPISEVIAAGEKRGYFVRNPDAAPARIMPGQKLLANVDDAKAVAQEIIDWDAKADQNFPQAMQDWFSDTFKQGSPAQWKDLPAEWTADIENVRWLPADVVTTRIKPVFSQKPDSIMAPAVGTLNSLARLATIQAKVGRYTVSNSVQSAIMLALTNPQALARGIRNQAAMTRAIPVVDRLWRALKLPDELRTRNPELYELKKVETGDVTATAGLPEFYVRAQNKMQAAEQRVTGVQHTLGQVLGDIADNPYRIASLDAHGARWGIKTDADWMRLLKSEDPNDIRIREQIRQQVRDDMLDFDRLSPWERQHVSRFLFIWPFVRASLRWPVTFARDYPVRTGVAASLAAQDDYVSEPVSTRDMFNLQVGPDAEYNAGWVTPYGPGIEMAGNVQQGLAGIGALAGGKPLDMSVLSDMMSPWLQDAGGAVFGRGPTGEDLARSLVPGYAGTKDIVDKGVKGVPTVARFTPKKGTDRLSRYTLKKRDEDKAKLRDSWNKAKQLGRELPDPDDAAKAFEAWWLYQEYARRAKFGAREQGRQAASTAEKAIVMNRVAREIRPELKIADDERVRTDTDQERVQAYYDWLYRQLFDARSRVQRAGRDE